MLLLWVVNMSVLIPTPELGCFGKDLDELFPVRGLLKAAASKVLDELLEAKRRSDIGDYKGKREILRRLMRNRPQEWIVDSPHPRHPGITHTPTRFRLHTLRQDIPDTIAVEDKSLGTRRYDAGTPGPNPSPASHPSAVARSQDEELENQRKQKLVAVARQLRPRLQESHSLNNGLQSDGYTQNSV